MRRALRRRRGARIVGPRGASRAVCVDSAGFADGRPCASSLARLVGSVITPFGWAALAATVVALAVGYGLGWLEFAAAGLALAFLLVLSALFLIGRTRFTVELEVPVVRTVVGSPVTGRVVLGSEGRRPLWGARLEVQIGESAVPVQFGAGASSTTEFRIPADAARGRPRGAGPHRSR